jgi:L-alanine-DL-glutamate epimerase-like enolase superfamily enzyme
MASSASVKRSSALPEVSAHLHETAAPLLLGQIPKVDHALRAKPNEYLGTHCTGAEARGASAVGIALWDLLGKASAAQPSCASQGQAGADAG